MGLKRAKKDRPSENDTKNAKNGTKNAKNAISHQDVRILLPPKLQRRGLVFKRKLVTMERV